MEERQLYTEKYANLSRKALIIQLETERQEWLAAGMSEAAIFYIHFGADGKDGDYRIWLSERKYIRADHKYAPGTPVSIDAIDPENAWINSGRGSLDDADSQIDIEAALGKLTELQRFCFTEVMLKGHTEQVVAKKLGMTQQSVHKHIKAAKKKLQNIFTG